MTSNQKARARQIYQAALKQHPAQRDAFLANECAGDSSLRAEVEALLGAGERVGGTPQSMPTAPTMDGGPGAPPAAQCIGSYKLMRQIGGGGMGAVYLAVRADDQYKKLVAIKLIKRGMDTDTIIGRFRNERQILASLDHPNIARFLDGGATEEGLPYFVMEYIEGERIDRYCDSHRLSTFERLKLFRDLCSAVHYAHQNLIVHRDIKPGNILITADGTPKLLDFGIAKLMSPTLTAQTIVPTAAGMQIMTPEYASPEQVRGEPITISTDVYSLGVLLYELLTGHRPYRLASRLPDEYLRIICEEEPTKPSSVIQKPEEGLGVDGREQVKLTPELVSKTRDGEPRKLRRRLLGDVDNIVLMAMRKEPQRRYSSVEQLSEDIRRHMEGLPIIARKDTLGYRSGKFIMRHKTGVAASCLLLLLLIAGITGTTIGLIRAKKAERAANEAAENARQVSDFLTDLFKVSDPSEARGNTITAREILDRGALKIGQDLKDQPLVQASLTHTMGRVYDSLGLYDQALSLEEAALNQRMKLLGEQHLDVTRSLAALGTVQWHKGEYDRARQSFEKALALRKKLLSADDPLIADILHNLGNTEYTSGRYDDAMRYLNGALAIRQKLYPDSGIVANTLNSLGAVAFKKGDFAEAIRLWERTLAIREKELGPDHPWIAQTLNNLAVVHTLTNDPAGAKPLIERAVRIQEKVLGPMHPDLAYGLGTLGDLAYRLGDDEAAKDYNTRAISILEKASPGDPERARFMDQLAVIILKQGNVNVAQDLYQQSMALREKALGPKHPDVAESLAGLAACARRKGRDSEAVELYERSLALCRRPDGEYYPQAVNTLSGYSTLLRAIGQTARATEMESLLVKLRRKE